MAVITFRQQFEASHTIAEVEAPDHAHFFQRVQVAIHRHEIAFDFTEGGVDFLVRQRVLVAPKHIKNGLTGSGDLARALAQLVRQFDQRRLDEPVRMRVTAAGSIHREKRLQCVITLATPTAAPIRMAMVLFRLNRCPSPLSNRMVVEICMKMPMTKAINSRE